MFSASTNTALAGHRSGVRRGGGTGEEILELHHTGVGKQQGRVITGDQWRRGHECVVLAGIKIQKALTNFLHRKHRISLLLRTKQSRENTSGIPASQQEKRPLS